MYKPTKINFQTFIRKTFHQKKKYLSKLTPVILRSKGLAPVHICPQKNPPTKITDHSPTQQPKNPMCHPWSCKSKMRRASKAGEKKKKKNQKQERKYMSNTPTKRTHPQTHKTQRIRTPKCTHSSQAKKHYVNPTPTLLPPLQAFPRGRRSVRSATKTLKDFNLAITHRLAGKSLYRTSKTHQHQAKWQGKINKGATLEPG